MGPELNNHQSKARRQDTLGKRCCSSLASASLLLACVALLLLDLAQVIEAEAAPNCDGRPDCHKASEKPREPDTCGTVHTAIQHGYDVKTYTVKLKDNYKLTLHRLVHPEDKNKPPPPAGKRPKPDKQPYLLVHGLIGTSASFVTNVDDDYRAPAKTYSAWESIYNDLQANKGIYEYGYSPTAYKMRRASHHEYYNPRGPPKGRKFAESLELQFDGEHMHFERKFRQAYKKYSMPIQGINYTTTSLAFTLSNYGYDVWLINLRGNSYSRDYNGPKNAYKDEYWDFKISSIIEEDLPGAINFIANEANLHKLDPIGLVTYSYSSIYAMGLLTMLPEYQKRLRPVIMMAPTLLTGTGDRKIFKEAAKTINSYIRKKGPFPVLGRKHSSMRSLFSTVCSTSISLGVCHLMERVLTGQGKHAINYKKDKRAQIMKRDLDCGQTSAILVREIIDNLSQREIHPNFKPFMSAGHSHMAVPGREIPERASVMLVHSVSDYISTREEVALILKTALKTLTLVDYVITDPDFGHTDFLFSPKNEYLVNAEVARMALVHDYLTMRDTEEELKRAKQLDGRVAATKAVAKVHPVARRQ